MKRAIFYLEPATKDGVEGYIVKGWENVLPAKRLPYEYYMMTPNFVNKGDFILIADYGSAFFITRGMFLSLKDWDVCYRVMLQAGRRLSEILHRPKIIKVKI
jgi:hypothetical protein